MINVIGMYLKDKLGLRSAKTDGRKIFLPASPGVNFDSVYDYLSKFLLETGCDSCEESASDGLGSEHFAKLRVRKADYIFRLMIFSEGDSITIQWLNSN